MPWISNDNGTRFWRHDGAVVKHKMGPSKLEWVAFEPDPSEDYLIRLNKLGLGYPRRWGTAAAAMRAVDREYPGDGQSPTIERKS